MLFRPGDPAAFAAAVARLAGDAQLRERLGAGARDNIAGNERTWRGNARHVAALANSLIAPPGQTDVRLASVPQA